MNSTLLKWLKFDEHSRMRRLFQRDSRGVSAIEFAFIFPVMITMYMGAVDISQVLTADRKITTLASTAADLVAQAETLTAADLTDIYSAAAEIVAPFPTAGTAPTTRRSTSRHPPRRSARDTPLRSADRDEGRGPRRRSTGPSSST